MKNKYKKGDVLKGEVNGRELEILEVKNGYYIYIDPKTGKKFATNCETLDRCLIEKVR